MLDLYGIRPSAIPCRAGWSGTRTGPSWHPMRTDAGPAPQFAADGPLPVPHRRGHRGLRDPGRAGARRADRARPLPVLRRRRDRPAAEGAAVVRAPRHREALRGPPATGAVDLAERISGDTSVGHALAHSLAVEDALGVELPDDAHRLRALLVELERLYNHVADLGALANDVGFGIANAHAQRIREQLLRINAAVTGHRLLRGAIRPGGVDTAPAARPRAAAVDRRRPRRGRRADPGQHRGLRPVRRHRGAGLRRRPRPRLPGLRRPGQRHAHRRPPRPSQRPRLPVTEIGASAGDVLARYTVRATSSPPRPH